MTKAYPNPSKRLCKILALLKSKKTCPTLVTEHNKLTSINLMGLKSSIYFWPYTIYLFALITPVSHFLLAGGSCSSACRSLISGIPQGHVCSHKLRSAWKHSQALMPTGREQPESTLVTASMLSIGWLHTDCQQRSVSGLSWLSNHT